MLLLVELFDEGALVVRAPLAAIDPSLVLTAARLEEFTGRHPCRERRWRMRR